MKITKVEIRFISDGGVVVESHPMDVPEGSTVFRCYTASPDWSYGRVNEIPIPQQPVMVKREKWIMPAMALDECPCPNDLRWVKASWEEPE